MPNEKIETERPRERETTRTTEIAACHAQFAQITVALEASRGGLVEGGGVGGVACLHCQRLTIGWVLERQARGTEAQLQVMWKGVVLEAG